MTILLDECLPVDFRHHLPGHIVHTVQWAGLKTLKNGQLLKQADEAGYDVFLTVDQGVSYQQNLANRKIAVLVFRTPTNQLEDLIPAVDTILRSLSKIRPAEIAVTG